MKPEFMLSLKFTPFRNCDHVLCNGFCHSGTLEKRIQPRTLCASSSGSQLAPQIAALYPCKWRCLANAQVDKRIQFVVSTQATWVQTEKAYYVDLHCICTTTCMLLLGPKAVIFWSFTEKQLSSLLNFVSFRWSVLSETPHERGSIWQRADGPCAEQLVNRYLKGPLFHAESHCRWGEMFHVSFRKQFSAVRHDFSPSSLHKKTTPVGETRISWHKT